MSSTLESKICTITAGIKKSKSIIKKKKKNDKIVRSAKTKLIVEVLISKALIDSYIINHRWHCHFVFWPESIAAPCGTDNFGNLDLQIAGKQPFTSLFCNKILIVFFLALLLRTGAKRPQKLNAWLYPGHPLLWNSEKGEAMMHVGSTLNNQ